MNPCIELSSSLPALFSCSDMEGRTRIRTPFLYPDGDVVDLFYSDRSGQPTLTDFGETLRWLRMQTPAAHRSPRQKQLIDDVCLTHGVELFQGMLMLRVRAGTSLASAVAQLGQACVRVADVWFTMRTRLAQSTEAEVAEFLTEQKIPFEQDEKLIGRSGNAWTVHFHTRSPSRSSLIYVLSSGSRASGHRWAEHVFTAWSDLSHLKAAGQLDMVSLFDDTLDVWADEDIRLLDQVSTIAKWSEPETLTRVLTGVAA
jgi:hypothetical protein